MSFEDENLYKEPWKTYPIKSTKSDNNNCLFILINQYKKNNTLSRISKGTPKLRTERKENVFGGKKGNIKDKRSTVAIMALKTNTILSNKCSFFI